MTQLSDDLRKASLGSGGFTFSLHASSCQGWGYIAKRLFDASLACAAIVALAPVFALIALAIWLDSPGPVLFRQVRSGRNGRPFTFLKFRSMVADAEALRTHLVELNEADGPLFKIRDDPRMTRIGRLLRRSSLDELPQLWNVLSGDMSLVGPRPPLPSEVLTYEPWQTQRLSVTPGITGLWQVSGRSNIPFYDMVLLDIEYIASWSLLLDLRILLRTLVVVITAHGAY